MISIRVLSILMATVMILVIFSEISEATYRKPPFNGSIFGKRGSTVGMFINYFYYMWNFFLKKIF